LRETPIASCCDLLNPRVKNKLTILEIMSIKLAIEALIALVYSDDSHKRIA